MNTPHSTNAASANNAANDPAPLPQDATSRVVAPRSPYSADKAAWHEDHIAELAAGRHPFPVHLQVSISDLCQQNCQFCSYRWEGYESNAMFGVQLADGTRNNNPNRKIPTERMLAIIDEFSAAGGNAIQLTGGGDPTVHPSFHRILRHALDVGLDVSLVTNGALLRDEDRELLMRAAWVRISLDSASGETYSKIRRVSARQFDAACYSIADLATRKKSSGSRVLIGVGFVVTADNWREVYWAANQAKRLGADNLRISAVFQPEEDAYFSGFFEEAAALCRRAVADFDDPAGGFRVFNNFGDRVGDLKQGAPDYSLCGYQHFTTYLGGDMNVYRCCGVSFNEQGLLGSIADVDFGRFWFSDAVQKKLAMFDARTCGRCQFNAKNRSIIEMIGRWQAGEPILRDGEFLAGPPEHVNFV